MRLCVSAHLIAAVIHLHVVPVNVQLHVLVAEHCGRLGVSVVAGHVISQHQHDVTGGDRGENMSN